MKFIAVIFAIFVLVSGAEEKAPKIINPDFLMSNAWEFQRKAQVLQNNFDQVYLKANGLISDVLGTEAKTRLTSFKNHSDVILNIYKPVYSTIEGLPIDECRSTAASLLENAVTGAGFLGTNCMKSYYNDVRKLNDHLTKSVTDLNQEYLKLSQFVYQSFASENALLDSEKINERINATYVELADKFNFELVGDDKWYTDQLAVLAGKHNACLDNAQKYVEVLVGPIDELIDNCKDIHDMPRSGKFAVHGFDKFQAEFQHIIDTFEVYKW